MIFFQIHRSKDAGLRLDRFLASNISDHSRSRIQTWIRSGFVLVNGTQCKTGYALELNDEIQVDPPAEDPSLHDLHPEPMDLDILYEDEQIAVLNKPAGLVIHPGVGNSTGTLVHGLLYHFQALSDLNGAVRPGIVHRLDKDTSGIILVAKTNQAHAHLADQFQNREVKKEYSGLTWGIWPETEGEINKPIGRRKKDPTTYSVSGEGKPSLTRFEVEKQLRHLALVSFFPKTGRTHQIRVHAAHMGFPIFGDETYGGGLAKTRGFLPEFTHLYKQEMNRFNRHALHARRLEFLHPEKKEPVIFETPLPKEYLNLVNSIESFYEG